MCPRITNLGTSMNGSISATSPIGPIINSFTLDKGEWEIIIGGNGIVVCHNISTNRPNPI